MLFSDPYFIFLFLPTILLLTVATKEWLGREPAFMVLIAGSLLFYAWWYPPHLLLLVGSVCINYWFGILLIKNKNKNLFFLGVIFNLFLIFIFKYTGFLTNTFNQIAGGSLLVPDLALPLAISFFTFQQIAYLSDVYSNKVKDTDFVHYALFVTFFPQLIAGPIVHHRDVIPQFLNFYALNLRRMNFFVGAGIFVIGLYKKIIFADGMTPLSDRVFENALMEPSFIDAWGGALAFGFQIYFDFSGYSDMAIGLALIFGIRLPLNFDSPYKAVSIIDFWMRWHMTLSRFLRDYVYIPLGGNRCGVYRRYTNLIIVMLVGGLWHGAAWTFVLWGGLHGLFLIIAHAFRSWRVSSERVAHPVFNWFYRLLTFVMVTFSWVFFRADGWSEAMGVVEGMLGFNGIGVMALLDPSLRNYQLSNLLPASAFIWFGMLLFIVWFMPNTQQLAAWLGDNERPQSFISNTDWTMSPQLLKVYRFAFLICSLIAFGTVILIITEKSANLAPFVYMVF